MKRGRGSLLWRAQFIDAVRDDTELSANSKLVAVMLASRSDSECAAWPSWRRLEHDTGLSRNTVKRAVAELEARRLVLVERRFGSDGQRDQSNVFRLLARGSSPDPMRGEHVTPPAQGIEAPLMGHLARSPRDPMGSAGAPPMGSRPAPEPSPSEPTTRTSPRSGPLMTIRLETETASPSDPNRRHLA